jgi:DNA repair exonuclease SbcCD nuclease subunit
MRVVVASDFHGDHVTHGVSRFDDVELAVSASVEAAIAMNADGYFFLGDLCDPDDPGAVIRCSTLAMRVACTLAGEGIPSIWIAGNHDVLEDGSGATTLSPLGALVTLVNAGVWAPLAENPCLIPFGDYEVMALPFVPTDRSYDPEKEAARMMQAATRPVIVLSHLTVPGVQPGEETADLPRGRDVIYPVEATKGAVLRLQGHYHRRQTVDLGVGPPMHIPGSLVRLTFNEENNEPGYLIVELP